MPSLCDNVVHNLSEDILTGTYKTGEKLPTEVALIERFKVSRSVIREAVSRLQAANLVATKHGVGTFVLDPRGPALEMKVPSLSDMNDVLDILTFRIDLEAGAAAQAASKRSDADLTLIAAALNRFAQEIDRGNTNVLAHDMEFHLCIARASGNRYYVDVQEQLGRGISPRTRLGLADLAALDRILSLQQVYSEHRAIYNAILRGDPEDARAAMRVHLSNSRERLSDAHEQANARKAKSEASAKT